MALDSVTPAASGQASAWPDASSSSSLGAGADIMAFLRAMVDAHASADADALALTAAVPTESGATTGATGTSPARAVVPPWMALLDGDRLSAQRLAQLLKDRNKDAAAADGSLLTAVPRIDQPIDPLTPPSSWSQLPSSDQSNIDALRGETSSVAQAHDDDVAAATYLVLAATVPAIAAGTPTDADALSTAAAGADADRADMNLTADTVAGRKTGLPQPDPVASGAPAVAGPSPQALRAAFDADLAAKAADAIDVPTQAEMLAKALNDSNPRIAAPSERKGDAAPPLARPAAARAPVADALAVRSHLASEMSIARSFAENSSSSGDRGHQRGDHEPSFKHDCLSSLAMDQVAPSSLFAVASSGMTASGVHQAEAPAHRSVSLPNEAGVASTLVRSMQWQYRNGVGTAVVNLDPGYLGDVRIALQVDGNAVSATLHAANPEVRAWMQANEGALRQSLEAQGLSLDRLVVAEEGADDRRSPDGRRQAEQDQEQDRPRPRRAPRGEDTATFAITV